jgi:hypothetical protein
MQPSSVRLGAPTSLRLSTPPLHPCGLLVLVLALLALPASLWAKDPWQPVTPAELAPLKSTFEPGAPAEILELRLNLEDEDQPRNRHVERYLRYKIYDPEKADRLLRFAEAVVSYDGTPLRTVRLRARLTLPDGTIRKFDDADVHVRDLAKQGSADSFWHKFFGSAGFIVKEKFLAIGGVPAGAVLEYQVVVDEYLNFGAVFNNLQFDSLPVRKVSYRQKYWRYDQYMAHLLYRMNTDTVEVHDDLKGHVVTAEARDLHSLPDEPYSGPLPDRAVTLLDCYIVTTYVPHKGEHPSKSRLFGADERWGPIATLENWITGDHLDLTKKVRSTAAEITRGATTDLQKARLIHDHVQRLHQRFIRTPSGIIENGWASSPISPDDVLEFEKGKTKGLSSRDFLWLTLSLARAAGLQAEIVMLPDRGLATFKPYLIAPVFLPARAVAYRIGEAWHFSMPDLRNPIAFDELPWQQEGLKGLLALDQKQEFIDIPYAPATQSLVRRTGRFALDAAGTLGGSGVITYHGHAAHELRGRLLGLARDAQLAEVQRSLAGDFEGAEIEVTDLTALDDVYAPLEATFKLSWPGFGVVTDDRLIFRPFVFRTTSHSPFAAEQRTGVVAFNYCYQDLDELTIALPEGYEPEAKEAPPSYPGPVLSYEISLGLDRAHMTLHVSRKFSHGLMSLAPKNYPLLKKWHDSVALSDQHNLILVQTPKTAPAAQSATTP